MGNSQLSPPISISFGFSSCGAIERAPMHGTNSGILKVFVRTTESMERMSSARALTLRKQKSCVDDSNGNTKIYRRSQPQKQFSIDRSRENAATKAKQAELSEVNGNGSWRRNETIGGNSLRVITAINCRINNGNPCEGYVIVHSSGSSERRRANNVFINETQTHHKMPVCRVCARTNCV